MNEHPILRTLKARARLLAAVLILAGGLWAIVYQTQLQQQRVLVRLFGDVQCRDHEIARMELALASRGLVNYTCQDHTILVPKSERATYLQAIKDDQALPAAWTSNDQEPVLANPFMSRSQQQVLQRTARERELRRLVMQLPFVDEAFLEFDRASHHRMFEPELLTAVVVVKPSQPEPLGLEQVVTIRQLVAGAIAGMSEDGVVVTDIHAGVAYADPIDEDNRLKVESVRYRVNRQKQIMNRIRHALSEWPEIEIEVFLEVQPSGDGTGKVATHGVGGRTSVANATEPGPRTADALVPDDGEKNAAKAPSKTNARAPGEILPINLANGTASVEGELGAQIQLVDHQAAVPDVAPQAIPAQPVTTLKQPRQMSDGEKEKVRIVIRVPKSTITARLPSHRTTRSAEDALVRREFGRMKPDLIRRARAALPLSPPGDEPEITVVLKPDEAPQGQAQTFWSQLQQNITAQWPLIAVVLVGVLAVAFLRPSEAASKEPQADSPPCQIPEEDDSDIKKQLSSLIDQNPDAAASVLKQWLSDSN